MSGVEIKNDIFLEKYKYILDQKKNLNAATFKIASVYQVLLLAILTGQFSIVWDVASGSLDKILGIQSTWGLFALTIIITLIMIFLILGGIFSWINYRRDEYDLEVSLGMQPKEMPKISHCIRWYESYVVLSGIVAVFIYFFSIQTIILSDIHRATKSKQEQESQKLSI